MKISFGYVLATVAAGLQLVAAINLTATNINSVKAASRTIAYGLQSYYVNNQSTTPAGTVGTFPGPTWYWWKGAAIWGGMIDYWAYTGDGAWNSVIQQGILAQVGPDFNFEPPAYNGNLGNDDQAIWAVAALSALEYGFPVPAGQGDNRINFWLELATNVFDRQIARWDTKTCGGGLYWQVFESNKGYTYKNSISNGGLFQIAARLARYTGNDTYVEWANKTWDWMDAIGLIGSHYEIFDGSDSKINCTELDHTQWTYNPAMMIYGAAMLANYTNEQVWKDRTQGLLTAIEGNFFNAFPENATNIMVETACEPFATCSDDQYAFKAFLSRWLAKSAVVFPSIEANVNKYLTATANAVAKSCTGGDSGTACGTKWYVDGFDGRTGYDQQLTALETVQSLLLVGRRGAVKRIPDTSDDVSIQVVPVTSTFPLTPPSPATPAPQASSNGVPSFSSSTSLLLTRSTTGTGLSANTTGRAAIATLSAWAVGCGIILPLAVGWIGAR